jgi:hypothetical protein
VSSQTSRSARKGQKPRTYKHVRVNKWDDLHRLLYGPTYSHSWAFRGIPEAEWDLKTTLERLEVHPNLAAGAERALLTSFKRRAHHYLREVPLANDNLEWLALMQHHGAPTRLLDWTRSPYVALFFAVVGAEEAHGRCALWAINIQWCMNRARQLVEQTLRRSLTDEEPLGSPNIFNEVFLEASQPFVAPLQPYRMNERLTIQQGLFLAPGNVSASFMENLAALGPETPRNLHKITAPRTLRHDALKQLMKMNLSRAALFPGLDGFAQSLGVNVELATRSGSLSSETANIARYEEWGF